MNFLIIAYFALVLSLFFLLATLILVNLTFKGLLKKHIPGEKDLKNKINFNKPKSFVSTQEINLSVQLIICKGAPTCQGVSLMLMKSS